MVNIDQYKEMTERMKDHDESTNDSSNHGEGGSENRATLVPPGGFPTLQMLNIMEKMKENNGKESEISLTPMNLSTMLSGAGSRDLGRMFAPPPGGPSSSQIGQRQPSDGDASPPNGDDDVDVTDATGGGGGGGRERHPSADIRAQFWADLRKGNLPGSLPMPPGLSATVATPSSPPGSSAAAGSEAHPASSTTPAAGSSSPPPRSPPATPPPSDSRRSSSSPSPLQQSPDNSLPPRKRKVSQEHHVAAASAPTAKDDHLNGLHGVPVEGEHSGGDSPDSGGGGQQQQQEPQQQQPASLECKN